MQVWDRVGTIASAVCAVHCLLTGVALGLLSYVGLGFFGSLAADLAFLGVAIVVAAFAIYHGAKKHHSYKPALIFVLGLVLISIGHFGFSHRHGSMTTWSTLFSVLGGFSFVLFHVVNYRLQRNCRCRHCSTGD